MHKVQLCPACERAFRPKPDVEVVLVDEVKDCIFSSFISFDHAKMMTLLEVR